MPIVRALFNACSDNGKICISSGCKKVMIWSQFIFINQSGAPFRRYTAELSSPLKKSVCNPSKKHADVKKKKSRNQAKPRCVDFSAGLAAGVDVFTPGRMFAHNSVETLQHQKILHQCRPLNKTHYSTCPQTEQPNLVPSYVVCSLNFLILLLSHRIRRLRASGSTRDAPFKRGVLFGAF